MLRFVSFIIAFGTASTAFAQCGGVRTSFVQPHFNYHQPTVVVQKQVVVETVPIVAVPVIAVPVLPTTYGFSYQYNNDAALQLRLNRIEQLLQAQGAGVGGQVGQTAQHGGYAQPHSQQPYEEIPVATSPNRRQANAGANRPAAASNSQGGSDVESKAIGVLTQNCASCHTGAQAKGGIVIFTSAGVLRRDINRFSLFDAADTGRMPPAAQKDASKAVSDEDVETLRAWVRLTGGR